MTNLIQHNPNDPFPIIVEGVTSPLSVSGLTTGKRYKISVSATNIVGTGPSAELIYTPAAVPDAPTNVTAIAGDAQATVSFTPPVNNGGSPITGYLVTSSPGNVLASGASSPILVTGLTNGVEYTFTVIAINSVGDSTPSLPSGILPSIGSSYGGGFFAGQILENGYTFNIIVSPKANEATDLQWKTTATDGPVNSHSMTLGYVSTIAMNMAAYPAAQYCTGLVVNGYSDWYLPARDEFEVVYRNLKPDSTQNDTSTRGTSGYGGDGLGMGTNTNSVPTGSAYTASVPTTTTVPEFQSGGSECLRTDAYYWTSSEYNTTTAYHFHLNGAQHPWAKNDLVNSALHDNVRPIRKEPSFTIPLSVPEAPTNVLVAAGTGQVVVSFTAPTVVPSLQNDSRAKILYYTVIDTNSGLQTTGTSSPITLTGVSGLCNITIYATNGMGPGIQGFAPPVFV